MNALLVRGSWGSAIVFLRASADSVARRLGLPRPSNAF